MIIDNKAKEVLKKLIDNGFEAYIVGGYVRDKLLGLDAYDIDITTNASIDDIKKIFSYIDNGSKYQSITIIVDEYSFEITTFRRDVSYKDHRHPVTMVAKTLSEDLERRDFTINALALDYNGNIIDKFNGIDDINKKIIRTIGDPNKRFDEDTLRILRGIYLKTKLGFEFDRQTLDAIYRNAFLVKDLSGMRKKIELYKMIKYNKDNSFIDLFIKTRIVDSYKSLKKGFFYMLNNNIVINDVKEFIGACAKLNKGFDFELEYDSEFKSLLKDMLKIDLNDKMTLLDKSYDSIKYANDINRVLKKDYIKNFDEAYKMLPIKSIKDINATSYDLMKIIKPENIGVMQQKIAQKILNNEIQNTKDDIIKLVIEENKMMEEVIKSTIYAKVDQIMNSDGMVNLIVTLDDKTRFNLKIESERAQDLDLNCIYEFNIAKNSNSDKLSAYVLSYKHVTEIEDTQTKNDVFRKFMEGSPIDYTELKKRIEEYIENIKNNTLHNIVKTIIDKYAHDFYLYPAASKLHHAYVGGLAYHTLGMLDVAKAIAPCYPYINYDLLISGVILHDVGKVIEFSGVENTEYAMKGQLLGHLLIGCDIISQTARDLGVSEEEDVLMLLHMVASHHGLPQYGAIKRPATAEGAMLWHIDTIDSKFRVLGEELSKIKEGEFTEPIGVMDRVKFYKHK